MAQHDTGLGWSAKDGWLLQVSGQIGSVNVASGGNMYPRQPLPIMTDPTAVDVETAGRHLFKYTSPYNVVTDYYSAANGTVFAFVAHHQNGNWDEIGWITADSSCTVYNVNHFAQTSLFSSFNTWSAITGTSLYAHYMGGGYGSSTFVGDDLPVFTLPDDSSASYSAASQEAASYITIADYAIQKDNVGYAVACIAKWRTAADVVIQTPILISTDTSFTDMTCSSYMLAKYNTRRDGMKFYMAFFQDIDSAITSSLPVYDISDPEDPYANLDEIFNLICAPDQANVLVTETVDPYEDFGNTEEDAGNIDPNPEDDDIDFDDLPTKSFASAGFCRIFNPDVSDLNALASYMWTDQTFLQTVINHLKQILENPIEAIISLSMVPVQPSIASTKVPVNVMFINTGVSMYPVTSQFVEVDCGTLNLEECYGGALDYNPYTRVQIYLPYIGIVQLDTDEVMAKTLHLKYNVDVVTGICCAELKADNKLLYSFSGHCAVSQPITSADFSSYLNAAVAAAKVAVGVATGMSATTATAAAAEIPPAVPGRPPTSSALVPFQSSGAIGPHLGSPAVSSSHGSIDFSDIPEPESGGGVSWGELAKPGNVNTVASAMGGKMVVQHSGGFSGNSGYLAKRRPYLIIIRPRIANPKNYAQHFGRTSMEYLNLGSCTGYTKVQSVHLTGFDATNPELSEISSLLKGGVLM